MDTAIEVVRVTKYKVNEHANCAELVAEWKMHPLRVLVTLRYLKSNPIAGTKPAGLIPSQGNMYYRLEEPMHVQGTQRATTAPLVHSGTPTIVFNGMTSGSGREHRDHQTCINR